MSPPRRRSSKDKYKRRSRSRSRDRRRYEDRRSRSRSRDRAARRHRSRSPRYRSRSPTNRSYDNRRSRDRSRDKKSSKSTTSYPPPVQRTENLADLSMEEKEMMKQMGFCSFDTTKGRKVEGNDVGAVHVILKRKYRQYMNRKGGFNRPLDFVA